MFLRERLREPLPLPSAVIGCRVARAENRKQDGGRAGRLFQVPSPFCGRAMQIVAVEEDVLSALVNLGYQRAAAEKALTAAAKDGSGKSFDQMFRTVLGRLSK